MNLKSEQKNKAIVGISTKNERISIPLSEISCMLVTGVSGSGKTITLRSLIVSLLATTKPDELKFIIVDAYKSEYLAYSDMPFMMKDPIVDDEETIETLKDICDEIDRRLKVMADKRYRNVDKFNQDIESKELEGEEKMPHIVIVFDDFTDFIIQYKEAKELFEKIATNGNMSGVHLILSTQFARKDIVDEIKDYVDANIALRTSPIESEVVLGEKRAGGLSSFGDFYFTHKGSDFERGQAPYIDDEELKSIFKYIKKPDSQNKIPNEPKSIFKKLFKGKNNDVEQDTEYRFPLTLFKEYKELIDEKESKAEAYAKEMQQSLKDVFLQRDDIKFKLSDKLISKNAVTYLYELQSKPLKTPNIKELEYKLEQALDKPVELRLSGRILEVIVPLPKEYRIPINVKTMIKEVF